MSMRVLTTKVSTWNRDNCKIYLTLRTANGRALATVVGTYTNPGLTGNYDIDVQITSPTGVAFSATRVRSGRHWVWTISTGNCTLYVHHVGQKGDHFWKGSDEMGTFPSGLGKGLPQLIGIGVGPQRRVRVWRGRVPQEDLGRQKNEGQMREERQEDLIGELDRRWTRPKHANGRSDMSGEQLYRLGLATRMSEAERSPSADELALLFGMMTFDLWEDGPLHDANEHAMQFG